MERGDLAPAGEAQMLADLQRQLAELMQQPVPSTSRPSSRQCSRPASSALQAGPNHPACGKADAEAAAAAPLLLQSSGSQHGSPRIRAVFVGEAEGSSGLDPNAGSGTAIAAAPGAPDCRTSAATSETDGSVGEQHQVCAGEHHLGLLLCIAFVQT